MKRVISALVIFGAFGTIQSCTSTNPPAPPEPKASVPPQASVLASDPSGLKVGEATGSYTAKGEVVELKYAYAGRAQRFGSGAMVILITDKPVPPEAQAEEIKSQKLLQNGTIRGLEYAIDKDGIWVRFHPSQYQESTNKQLKEYTVDGEIVRGTDENTGDMSDGKYARSVKFIAKVVN